MDEKNYNLTEEIEKTETVSDEGVEHEKAPRRRSPEIRIQKRTDVKESGDQKSKLIAIMALCIFLFTVLLTLALVLLNSADMGKDKDKDKDRDKDGTVDVGGDGENNGENDGGFADVGAITDYRTKPTITDHKNAAESATAYRPTGNAGTMIEGITSSNALLFDATSGKIVAGKGIDDQVEIASMTKVMTLIVACDLIKSGDMYKAVKITYDQARMKGYSTCYINKNNTPETVYVVDLLYGLILESGADCAYGLAESLSGSEAAFVKKMNEKAAAIGMTDTKFTNCVGKDDYGKNYSTMRDVAAMLNYAMENQLCYNILTTEKWIPVGDYAYAHLADGSYEVRSMVHAGIKKQDIGSVSFLGGKSGNEINAGYCLVSAGEYSGKTYICVTAGHASSSYADTAYIYKNYVK